jgi:hypothetical protein
MSQPLAPSLPQASSAAGFDSTSVLDGLAEPLAVIDRAGLIAYANREFER